MTNQASSDPLEGLSFGILIDQPYIYTSPFNAPRDYDGDGVFNDLHEGIDADVFGAGDSLANVLCVYDGVVNRSIEAGLYGQYIRILHEYNGAQFYTRYTHLDTRFVKVGEFVLKGTPIGEIGNSGNVSGEHVHFNVEGIGFGNSTDYVVAGAVDPKPYLPVPEEIVWTSPKLVTNSLSQSALSWRCKVRAI